MNAAALKALGLAALTVVVVTVLGVQQSRLQAARVELATMKATVQKERADREATARAWADHRAALMRDHARQQQEAEDAWNRQKAELEDRHRAADIDAQRLRNKLAAFAAPSGGVSGEADTATRERAEHRLAIVASLLAEGIGLVEESRRVIEHRDLEVTRLFDQVHADRKACQAGDKSAN